MFLGVSAIIPAMSEPDWRRAGRALEQRRVALGYTQKQAADLDSHIGQVTWGKIERGESVRELQRAAAERAVGWQSGTLREIAEGTQPPADTPPADPSPLLDDLAQARQIIDRVADRLREWKT